MNEIVLLIAAVALFFTSTGAWFAGILTAQSGTAGRLERRARGWSQEKAVKIMWTGGIVAVLSAISALSLLSHMY